MARGEVALVCTNNKLISTLEGAVSSVLLCQYCCMDQQQVVDNSLPTNNYSKRKLINIKMRASSLAMSGRALSARRTSTARATLGRHLIAANSLAKGAVAHTWV